MPLRKSPTRTPALIAANRRNAGKSTGPRTARGKAWSRLNRLTHGARSPEYAGFTMALGDLPAGRVLSLADGLRASKWVRHPLYRDLVESFIEAEAGMCRPRIRSREPKKVTFEAGMLLKTKGEKNAKTDEPKIFMKTSHL